MLSFITALLVSTPSFAAPTRVPVAEEANEVSAGEAYALAAEYAGRVSKLEKRAAKASSLSKAQIKDLQADASRLDGKIDALDAKTSASDEKLSKRIDKLQSRVRSLRADVSRLDARQIQLTVGIGANGLVAPEIPEHVADMSVSGVADLGITVQDRKSGWVLSSEFGIGPDNGYSIGGYGAYFAKVPGAKRLALGGGVTGGFTAYDAFGEPHYGAYRWNVGAMGYVRGNVVTGKSTHGWPMDVVLRPYVTIGESAVPEASAFEVTGGAALTFQIRKELD